MKSCKITSFFCRIQAYKQAAESTTVKPATRPATTKPAPLVTSRYQFGQNSSTTTTTQQENNSSKQAAVALLTKNIQAAQHKVNLGNWDNP